MAWWPSAYQVKDYWEQGWWLDPKIIILPITPPIMAGVGIGGIRIPQRPIFDQFKAGPVVSSLISAAGYHEDKKTLRISFHDGSVYDYEGVPEKVADLLWRIDSPGKYFHRTIKNHYSHRKIKIGTRHNKL